MTTEQGVSGLAVREGIHYRGAESSQALASALEALLHAPGDAEAVGKAGRQYVVAEHDWSIAARQLEQVYAIVKQEKEDIAACV